MSLVLTFRFTIASIINIGANLAIHASTKEEIQQVITYIARPIIDVTQYIEVPNVMKNVGRMFHHIVGSITDPEDIRWFADHGILAQFTHMRDFFWYLEPKEWKKFLSPPDPPGPNVEKNRKKRQNKKKKKQQATASTTTTTTETTATTTTTTTTATSDIKGEVVKNSNQTSANPEQH